MFQHAKCKLHFFDSRFRSSNGWLQSAAGWTVQRELMVHTVWHICASVCLFLQVWRAPAIAICNRGRSSAECACSTSHLTINNVFCAHCLTSLSEHGIFYQKHHADIGSGSGHGIGSSGAGEKPQCGLKWTCQIIGTPDRSTCRPKS